MEQDNCQVSLSLANRHTSLPMVYQLYLPKEWAEDDARRRKAGVPDGIAFKAKSQMAPEQVRWTCPIGLPRAAVGPGEYKRNGTANLFVFLGAYRC